jgi:hypothetical protein
VRNIGATQILSWDGTHQTHLSERNVTILPIHDLLLRLRSTSTVCPRSKRSPSGSSVHPQLMKVKPHKDSATSDVTGLRSGPSISMIYPCYQGLEGVMVRQASP